MSLIALAMDDNNFFSPGFETFVIWEVMTITIWRKGKGSRFNYVFILFENVNLLSFNINIFNVEFEWNYILTCDWKWHILLLDCLSFNYFLLQLIKGIIQIGLFKFHCYALYFCVIKMLRYHYRILLNYEFHQKYIVVLMGIYYR